jgi:hypothetical protein
MRAEDKANWAVYQKAISLLRPELMRIRNANTNIRASMPLWQQTLVKFSRALANRVGISIGASPSWWDRSWPETRQAIDGNPSIQSGVTTLAGSHSLNELGIFEPSAIETVVTEHRSGEHNHSILLSELLTLQRTLVPF